MERKVGEIFEYNGEWYQCVEQPKQYDCETGCGLCSFKIIGNCDLDKCSGTYRSDGKSVIFKKLEKFGEPYVSDGRIMQKYKDVYSPTIFTYKSLRCYNGLDGRICIEIPKNKEDMNKKKLNLKPFDLEAAKQGKPVCTRDGRKARIICFDYKGDSNAYPILALISTINSRGVPSKIIAKYTEDGRYAKYNNVENNEDLMILPEKKEGWVNIYNRNRPRTSSENCYIMTGVSVFETKEGAISYIDKDKEYIDTVKIEWEE